MFAFEELDEFLDKLNFPKVEKPELFIEIKGIDFERAYKAGSISFKDDGIYLEYNGVEYRGYMFIKEAWIERYNNYPRFHLTKCKTIEKFISNGRFEHRYEWSNANRNDLIDKTSGKEYKDEVLTYCKNCKDKIFGDIDNTNDFYESLDKSNFQEDIKTDMNGYTSDWRRRSKFYRESKKFTCEKCSIQPKRKLHRNWWHTHHINGSKIDNEGYNLQCLCILCHSNVDARHIANFSRGNNHIQLKYFTKEYLEELKNLNHPNI